jgi:signal transduction histidine kinase
VGGAALLAIIDVSNCIEPLKSAADERTRMESFLSVLAHELRNPLSALCQGLAILQGPDAGIDKRLLLDRMERQLRYFVRVVDDLLDVSRIVQGRLDVHWEHVRLDAVISEASTAVDAIAAAKGIQVHSEAPAEAAVQGDAVRLQQVLINLLKNAVTASEPGGHVFVSALAGDAVVEIVVRDTGRGIARERLPHLFDRAYEYGSAPGEGLGVGLGVVKRLVELHGGQVAAYSEGVGRGATLVVRLPSA